MRRFLLPCPTQYVFEALGQRLADLTDAPCEGRGSGFYEEAGLLFYTELVKAAPRFVVPGLLLLVSHGSNRFR